MLAFLVSPTFAQAPTRTRPYAEAKCSDANVFFCEDFEGQDIVNYGGNNCNSTWDNPALEREDICWAGGGSHQRSTIPLTGFDQATNRVWRISKSQSFTDINTGINTGTGNGTIAGFLRPEILGTGAREWYTRMNVYFSSNHSWPADLDFKMFYALPRSFVDPPSAAYEAGMYFQQDFWCSGSGNYNDVPCLRYSSNFQSFPYQNEYCPPLAPGLAPNGTQAPRFVKNRWYTLESHFKLAQNNTGMLELWVDGVKAYSTNRATCPSWGCPDMGYIMILGWMNSSDPQSGFYEVDNVIMSRAYIGPPGGGPPPPPPVACGDGIDNDGDGLIDYPADPGCSSASDTDELNSPPPPPPAQCADGVDNDSDGLIDYPSDPGCASTTDNDEFNSPPQTYQCSDGQDNDADGLIDYPADPGCSSTTDNDEFNAPPPTGNIVINFDSPAPNGSSGSYLNGIFGGINWGTNRWRWESGYLSDPTNHIYFANSSGNSRTFTFSPGPKLLKSMRVFTGISGTLTLTDNLGQTKVQSVPTGSMTTVTINWAQPSTTVTVKFNRGWELGVDDIEYVP